MPGPTWWKLEFPTEVQIDWINIWNRVDVTWGDFQYRIDKVKVTKLNTNDEGKTNDKERK